MLNVSGIINDSIVDGPGLRFTIFVQGCPHNCKGCHNPETHDYNKKCDLYSVDELYQLIISNPLLDGVTFSGGEPISEQHIDDIIELSKKIKDNTNLNIIVYTGYCIEQLLSEPKPDFLKKILTLLNIVDYIIDGPFVEKYKSLDCKFRGSKNQRFIDLKKGELL